MIYIYRCLAIIVAGICFLTPVDQLIISLPYVHEFLKDNIWLVVIGYFASVIALGLCIITIFILYVAHHDDKKQRQNIEHQMV